MAKFEIYQDGRQEYRWRLRAGNHRVIADSAEGYSDKADCEHGITLVRAMTDAEVYRDQHGAYRWRLRTSNGRTVADSGEGYVRQAGCLRALAGVRRVGPTAAVEG